nr:MAG TPA: AAA domain protein [Caudoviricetes sp.]
MAILVMIYGQSGSGKSTSLRNFKPEQVSIVNVLGKPFPFRANGLKGAVSDSYEQIANLLCRTPKQSIVIDDATYLMTNEFMRMARQSGYQKFTDMAANFKGLLDLAKSLPDNKVIYIMGHVERDGDGNEKFKTIGKMLDEKICVEGLFTIVLKTVVQDKHYYFSTQNTGSDVSKSPMGMFDAPLIDNDLAMVDKAIRDYYGLPANDAEPAKKNEKE